MLSLLVATPQLTGSFFGHATLLMLEEKGGALGLILNRPADMSLGELLPQVAPLHRNEMAYLGGPVERAGGWCLYREATGHPHEIQLAPQLWLTRESAVLALLLQGEQPFRLLLGYAGWSQNQLEGEVQQGSWLWGKVSPQDFDRLLWHTPSEDCWQEALHQLGLGAQSLGGSAKA